jgi:hypothetical protein
MELEMNHEGDAMGLEQEPTDRAAAEKRGAEARARGANLFDNPFYRSEAMPAQTEQALEEWQADAEAWEAGWRLEDAVRGG